MQRFLLNIFLGSIMLLTLGLSVYSYLVFANKRLLKNECELTPVHNLFAGDSHIQMGFNDAMIRNSKNIASAGECYQYTFQKLKYYVNYNKALTTVYLGFSYHNLSSYYEDFSFQTFPSFITLLSASDQIEFVKKFNIDILEKVNLTLFNAASNLFKHSGSYSFSGGYLDIANKQSVSDSMINQRILSQFYFQGRSLFPTSSYNIYYLKKIIELCKSNNIKLYLVNTPLYTTYISGIPLHYNEEFGRFVMINQVQTIDLSKFDLPANCFQPDGDHLNSLGATKLSIYTDSLLIISK